MKQKYTLSIADVELNVTVDEAPETVEYIVGVIDRKMRDILLRSKYCPKTQAALLCALDLCADKLKAKEEIEELNEVLEAVREELKASEEKYARTQTLSANIEKEKTRLEIENMKLRAALDEAKRTGNVPEIDNDAVASVKEEALPVQPEKKAASEASKKTQNKSRVGSMFDLLTFGDI